MKKLFITSIIVALPFAVSCDRRQDTTATGTGARDTTTTTERGTGDSFQRGGEVIERDSTTLHQQPADVQEMEVEKGSADVEYTTKRQVTETVLQEQSIPTVKICQSKADINEMDKDNFRALGFDKNAADRIVQAREQRGRFNSVDELGQIQGVSQDTLANVKDNLGVAPRQAQEED
jgi:DNA uptake protein ComE-like DNA-binding protein